MSLTEVSGWASITATREVSTRNHGQFVMPPPGHVPAPDSQAVLSARHGAHHLRQNLHVVAEIGIHHAQRLGFRARELPAVDNAAGKAQFAGPMQAPHGVARRQAIDDCARAVRRIIVDDDDFTVQRVLGEDPGQRGNQLFRFRRTSLYVGTTIENFIVGAGGTTEEAAAPRQPSKSRNALQKLTNRSRRPSTRYHHLTVFDCDLFKGSGRRQELYAQFPPPRSLARGFFHVIHGI